MTKMHSDSRGGALRLAEAYWTELRTAGALPRRSDLNPRALEDVLHQCFVLERIAPGLARFRIAGSHFSELSGMEMRGMPFTALFMPPARDAAQVVLEHVFSTPAIAECEMKSPAAPGAPKMRARMILLPMMSDYGDVSRILGAIATQGEIGHTPRRFQLDEVAVRDVEGGAPGRFDVTTHIRAKAHEAAPSPATGGFAEAQAEFSHRRAGRAAGPAERSYLRLVTDDAQHVK